MAPLKNANTQFFMIIAQQYSAVNIVVKIKISKIPEERINIQYILRYKLY